LALLEQRSHVNDESHQMRVDGEDKELTEMSIHHLVRRSASLGVFKRRPQVKKLSRADDELSSPFKPLIKRERDSERPAKRARRLNQRPDRPILR
jgi:hypothetical protein